MPQPRTPDLTLTPSSSLFLHYPAEAGKLLATVSDFEPLRNGSLRSFDLTRTEGLVSMPSFHAALAVLFVYALRHVRPLFWPVLGLDLLMLAATMPQGGHYLADVLGGLVVAAATVASVRLLMRLTRADDREPVSRMSR